jgi:hypothetical protein
MADNLNNVWNDVQRLLHDRRSIINLNVAFFERLGECYGKMSSLEVACRDTMIPIEVEAVREFLDKVKHLRTEVLASILHPLTVGNQLLEKLREIESHGSLDSRPDQIVEETKKSILVVEKWLEDLSDKRNYIETAFNSRKNQLEQCLILAQLTKDITELEKIVNKQRDEVLGTFTLGVSSKNAVSLIQDYGAWKIDSMALRDKSLKITKSTEDVVKNGNFIGEEACKKAYNVLALSTELYDQIDLRESLLMQSKEFFDKAEDILRKIDELELEMKNTRPGSPNFISIHFKMTKQVSGMIDETLQNGYALIDEVGRTKPEVQGVKDVVDEIERRRFNIDNALSKTSETHLKVSEQLNIFLQQYNDVFQWIESQKRDKIINGPINSMGENIHYTKECLNAHQNLLKSVEVKVI